MRRQMSLTVVFEGWGQVFGADVYYRAVSSPTGENEVRKDILEMG